jgi:hypothetical protein
LVVGDALTPAIAGSAHATGMKVWHFKRSHLFVTPDLRERMERQFPDLHFAPGFSEFIG